MTTISEKLRKHYYKKFTQFGAGPKGVDWSNAEDTALRYKNMLSLQTNLLEERSSFLDVGCGYGGLLEYAISKNFDIDYCGIDVAQNMIDYAQKSYSDAEFIYGDILNYQFNQKFDYVVCNGILTQKLDSTNDEMEHFANSIIKRMFELSRIGMAFNVMSNRVNYMVDNLYYRCPSELMEYCLNNFSHKVRIDHSYPLYEYTVYVYKR